MTATILVVEDEPAIQDLITLNLEQAGFRLLQALNAERAITILNETVPDLILLDWTLPGISGLQLARRLRTETPSKQVPIIMLTGRAREEDKLAGFDAGADDYITKPFSTRELIARIRSMLRRSAPHASNDVVSIGSLKVDPSSQRVTGNGQSLTLGRIEFRILHFLMTHPDRAYSRAELLDQVWGYHVSVEERTIDVHMRRLRQALDGITYAHMIETVRGVGYRLSNAGR